MSDTICGHERETLQWALAYAKDERRLDAYLCGPDADKPAEYAACRAVTDPGKLAASMAREGRRFGIESLVCRKHDDNTIEAGWWGHAGYLLPLPRARSILAAWLDLPDGAREDAERILRGES